MTLAEQIERSTPEALRELSYALAMNGYLGGFTILMSNSDFDRFSGELVRFLDARQDARHYSHCFESDGTEIEQIKFLDFVIRRKLK